MRERTMLAVALLALAPFEARAAVTAPDRARPVRLDLALNRLGLTFGQPKTAESPTLAGPQIHYAAAASGLDRIDPADMKVFGGEIGGNGVQGGAVVSLSWPTGR